MTSTINISQQSHKGTMSALVDNRMKIQVAKDGPMPLWADLQGMPEFTCAADAWVYIAEHDGEQLQIDGINFRVMPIDYPCKYNAFLEKMVQR